MSRAMAVMNHITRLSQAVTALLRQPERFFVWEPAGFAAPELSPPGPVGALNPGQLEQREFGELNGGIGPSAGLASGAELGTSIGIGDSAGPGPRPLNTASVRLGIGEPPGIDPGRFDDDSPGILMQSSPHIPVEFSRHRPLRQGLRGNGSRGGGFCKYGPGGPVGFGPDGMKHPGGFGPVSRMNPFGGRPGRSRGRGNPGGLLGMSRSDLMNGLELAKGSVRMLPLRFYKKAAILEILDQAEERIRFGFGLHQLRKVLDLLELAVQKVTMIAGRC